MAQKKYRTSIWQRNPWAFKVLILLTIGLLAGGGYWGYRAFKNAQLEKAANNQQAKKTDKFTFPDVKNNTINKHQAHFKSISVKKAQQQAADGIKLGLEMISKTQALPGQNMNLSSLSQEESKTLYQHFQNGESIQAFNDVVNYASPQGELQWGDTGTNGPSSEKTPQPGAQYSLDGGELEYTGSSTSYYIFNVDMKYHANDFPVRTIPLKLTVSRTGGQIVKVERTGKVSIEGLEN